jgi:hypothetical protein
MPGAAFGVRSRSRAIAAAVLYAGITAATPGIAQQSGACGSLLIGPSDAQRVAAGVFCTSPCGAGDVNGDGGIFGRRRHRDGGTGSRVRADGTRRRAGAAGR